MRCCSLLSIIVGLASIGVASAEADTCQAAATKVWTPPGGTSAGLTNCIRNFVNVSKAGGDPYLLIDKALPGIERRNITTGFDHTLQVVPWKMTLSLSDMPIDWGHDEYTFNGVEWLVPQNYVAQADEVRAVFVHGGNGADSALGPYYSGFTTRLANWTGLPVFAFDYVSDPVVPWPQNLRNVLSYVHFALYNGPDGPNKGGGASRLVMVADSEGTLVLTQALLALRDPTLRHILGLNDFFPADTSWIAGIVLSSAVLDIHCETPSFASNCYNYSDPHAYLPGKPGDPDTGNCTQVPTAAAKMDDCLWSYLEYFYGLPGLLSGAPRPSGRPATAEFRKRKDFFSQTTLTPLLSNLTGFPPLLLISATRDYFYSDGPRLHERACKAGVDVTSFNVLGAYHDFIEYSEGCGSHALVAEAIEAYQRIRAFVQRVALAVEDAA